MTYPAFPVAGNVPVMLSSFDPSFMLAGLAPTALYGSVLGTPSLADSGGQEMVHGNRFNQGLAMTGFTFENIVPPGFTGITAPIYFPQRIGKIYNWLLANGASNGLPFLT